MLSSQWMVQMPEASNVGGQEPSGRSTPEGRSAPVFVRLIALPVRLSFSAVWVAAQIGFRAGCLSARGGRVVGRRLGWNRVAIFGSGVLVGLLLSVAPGRALRRALTRMVGSRSVADANLRDEVIFELAHAAANLAPGPARG